jgi:CRP-like cAMP-binding protein
VPRFVPARIIPKARPAMNRDEIVEPLLRRLRVSTTLNEEDEQAIGNLPITLKRVGAGEPIVSYGDRPSSCCLVVDGFVLRSKIVGSGNRQILAFHQPGDIPDLQSIYLSEMDHDVSALGDAVLGFIPHSSLDDLIRRRPNVTKALWRDTLTDAAIFREWICNLGQRPASSRLAHLIIEIYTRLKAIGRTEGLSFAFPATQALFAEAIGTSSVHANRAIQSLRSEGVLELERGKVRIVDERQLKTIADFDALYLHLDTAL